MAKKALLAPGGQGADIIDPHHKRADMALVRRAIRQRWSVPDRLRDLLPEAMGEILTDTEEDPRNRIGAAKVLVAIEQQNQADDHLTDKNDRIDTGKATETVMIVNDMGE